MPQPSDHLIQPVTLTGRHVQLVPLSINHCDELVAAAQDGELWRLWYTGAPEPKAMGAEIERRLALQATGSMVPFTVLDGPAGSVVGMTTYMHIDQVNRRVETSSTWYAPLSFDLSTHGAGCIMIAGVGASLAGWPPSQRRAANQGGTTARADIIPPARYSYPAHGSIWCPRRGRAND